MKIEVNAKEFKRLSQMRAREAARQRVRASGLTRTVEHKAAKPNRGRVIDKAYRAWIRRQPCAAGPVGCDGPMEAAHLRFSDFAAGRINPGLQRKSDDSKWLVPLCRHHHQGDQHKRSERAFWADRNIDANALATRLRQAYEADQ